MLQEEVLVNRNNDLLFLIRSVLSLAQFLAAKPVASSRM